MMVASCGSAPIAVMSAKIYSVMKARTSAMKCENCENENTEFSEEDAYGNVYWFCPDCGHYTLEDHSGGE
jgi:ribosomal protein S27E